LEDRLKEPWVVCSEVNINKKEHDMTSAIKEYVSSSSASVSVFSPTASPSALSIPMSPPVPPAVPPAAIAKPLTGGTDDNDKELKDFIKMFKKQNRKSYKSKNSNTRRNKKNDK
jgi:hypothetical protein